MPLGKIQLRPGVVVELTPTANEQGWSQSQLVRFFGGQVQKYGGWARVPGIDRLQGTCRGMFGWADLIGTAHMAIGTEQRLYVLTGGLLSDITPLAQTSNIAPAVQTFAGSTSVTIIDSSNYSPSVGDWIDLTVPVSVGGIVVQGAYKIIAFAATGYTIIAASPATQTAGPGGTVPSFSTANASSTVTVTYVNHGLVAGGNFTANTTTSVGGLSLTGTYSVLQVLDANTFTINAGALATSSATASMNSGQMQIEYLLASGQTTTTVAGGFGVGLYGRGDYGKTNAGVTTQLTQPARTWSLDHFGQNLIASPDQGPIYNWGPPTIAPAMVIDPSAPIINKIVFAIAQTQIIMAAGSSVGSSYYPTLIRWCDSGDFTAWVATVANQAGSFQIPSGSYITAAISVGLGALIWTDIDIWAVTYQGPPYVFGFNQIGINCAALSKKAPAVFGHSVIWPSTKGFFRYDGGNVVPVPCPVWDIFWNNIDTTQTEQVCSGVNTLFNEISWFFPCTDGQRRYVKWNFLENVWDYGLLDRTAWVDHTPMGNPMATDSAGLLYQHEVGNDADGVPMQSYAQSGYYDIADGDVMSYINCIIPDFISTAGSSIDITVLATDYPGEAPRSYGPFTVTPTTQRINCSLRGRQVAFRVSSSDISSFWRMGAVRFNRAQAGKRP